MNIRSLLVSAALILFAVGGSTFPRLVMATSEPAPKTEDDDVKQARTFHILVQTRPEIERVRLQIHGQSRIALLRSFMEAARRSSIDPSSSPLGGDLGMVHEGQMVKEFERAIYSVPLHEVSGPIQTQFGWHLVLVTDRGVKPVKEICSHGLSKSLSNAATHERSALEFTSIVKSPSELHPAVLDFMGSGWGAPLKDGVGNLGYLRTSPKPGVITRSVVWHTEYVRALYNAYPQGCSRSARREFEVHCSNKTAALIRITQYEGRAASGRALWNHLIKKPEHINAQLGTITDLIVRTACD